MRIGIDARALVGKNMTGIATYLDCILKYLAEHDRENEYILYSSLPYEEERNYGPNFTVKVVKRTKEVLWAILDLTRAIRKDNLDVFWGPNYELPLRVKGVRYVLTIHDLALLINSGWGDRRTTFTLKVMAPWAVRRADRLLADSESTKQDLIRLCKAKEAVVRTVYLGGYEDQTHLVSAEGLVAAKQKYGIGEKYFFFVGTIEPRKNIDTLVKAFELLAAKDPDVQLVIAGGIGWNCDDVLTQIRNSPYADRILQVGYVEKQEKLDLYAGAAAYVLPSHYEGFGLPVLEAMSLGGIVITSNNSSLPEVVGEAALYVDNENDETALAALMEQVLKMDSAERQRRIELGIQQAAKFSWEKCAQETVQELLGKELSI